MADCLPQTLSLAAENFYRTIKAMESGCRMIINQPMVDENLYKVAEFLHLVPPLSEENADDAKRFTKEFLLYLFVYRYERRPRQLDTLNEMPLYPIENIFWDENVVPNDYFNGEGCLALNKLNLQFLTLYDYLLRNFHLFQLESTYEIRQDIEDALFRLKPWKHEESDKDVVFGGWARMALPITTFIIVEHPVSLLDSLDQSNQTMAVILVAWRQELIGITIKSATF